MRQSQTKLSKIVVAFEKQEQAYKLVRDFFRRQQLSVLLDRSKGHIHAAANSMSRPRETVHYVTRIRALLDVYSGKTSLAFASK